MKIIQVAKTNFRIVVLSVVVFVMICHTSCHNNEVYYHFDEIKSGKWNLNDTLSFTIDSTCFDLNSSYDIDIEVTNTINYPYQNLWLFVEDNLDNDSVYSKVSKEYLIADESGRWLGSGFGILYQSSFPYKHNIRFREKRNYTVKIVHGMRDEVLEGIEKVGLKVTLK